jgi:hypothetical protein
MLKRALGTARQVGKTALPFTPRSLATAMPTALPDGTLHEARHIPRPMFAQTQRARNNGLTTPRQVRGLTQRNIRQSGILSGLFPTINYQKRLMSSKSILNMDKFTKNLEEHYATTNIPPSDNFYSKNRSTDLLNKKPTIINDPELYNDLQKLKAVDRNDLKIKYSQIPRNDFAIVAMRLIKHLADHFGSKAYSYSNTGANFEIEEVDEGKALERLIGSAFCGCDVLTKICIKGGGIPGSDILTDVANISSKSKKVTSMNNITFKDTTLGDAYLTGGIPYIHNELNQRKNSTLYVITVYKVNEETNEITVRVLLVDSYHPLLRYNDINKWGTTSKKDSKGRVEPTYTVMYLNSTCTTTVKSNGKVDISLKLSDELLDKLTFISAKFNEDYIKLNNKDKEISILKKFGDNFKFFSNYTNTLSQDLKNNELIFLENKDKPNLISFKRGTTRKPTNKNIRAYKASNNATQTTQAPNIKRGRKTRKQRRQ